MLISPKVFSKNSFWTLIFRSQIFYHRVSVIIVSISYVQQKAYKKRGMDRGSEGVGRHLILHLVSFQKRTSELEFAKSA